MPLRAPTLALVHTSQIEVNLVLFWAEVGGCSNTQETQNVHTYKTYNTYAISILRETSRVYTAIEIEDRDGPAQLWFSLMRASERTPQRSMKAQIVLHPQSTRASIILGPFAGRLGVSAA